MTIKFVIKIVNAQDFHGSYFKSLMRAAKQVVDLLTNDKTVEIATCMTFLNRIDSLSSKSHIRKIINI